MSTKIHPSFTSTRNACKLCTPLGACLAFKGVEGCVPLLHGSQGCATYIRRYMISHYKEPVDIASSSFGESSTIFGGKDNLFKAIHNIIQQYHPSMIGIATTCLSETIGDDVHMYLHEYRSQHSSADSPALVHVSTPSYTGTHADGFYDAIRAVVESLSEGGTPGDFINLVSGMFSPSDIRYLKEILIDFGLDFVLLPDYSDTLDGPAWETYKILPEGGTLIKDIQRMGRASLTIELGRYGTSTRTTGEYLYSQFGVPTHRLNYPIGIRNTDQFFQKLETASGIKTPPKYRGERNRLIDAYADAHKYLFAKRAIVYGEEDFVMALVDFLLEIGIIPVLCATGGNRGNLKTYIENLTTPHNQDIAILDDSDFLEMEEIAKTVQPDILIGNSKGYKLATSLNIPLVRVGFPIHDRFGGSRILHLGYRGTQNLLDLLTNTLIQSQQSNSNIGYSYM